jgi:His-Xaa-Ser system radical SAM maturase HxsB
MQILPFRYRQFDDSVLVTSEGGDFVFLPKDIIPRILSNQLSDSECEILLGKRIIAPSDEDWRVKSLALEAQQRFQKTPRSISYLILVPTLRCNLTCSYCQVSRAPIDAHGYDWDESTLGLLDDFFDKNVASRVKIEFQGGEISLRPDLIGAVEVIAKKHCSEVELVACTNLYEITPEFEKFISEPNFFVSTSLDGDDAAMMLNRTGDLKSAKKNIKNIHYIIDKYGIDKVSFLPTITEATRDKPEKLIDIYFELGASSIFLRPVNYMGFARKRHEEASTDFESWVEFFERSFEHIKKLNRTRYFEEMYLGDLVRRIFIRSDWTFVDFRSPSKFLHNYALVDFDGSIYPSDEARMLTRTKTVDLSVGSLAEGFDEEKISQLNFSALNQTNPDCIHCSYLPYCGVDTIDDLSRYGRVDLPKSETWFCNKQMFLFDWIFEKIKSRNTEWLNIFSRWIYRRNNPQKNLDVLIA